MVTARSIAKKVKAASDQELHSIAASLSDEVVALKNLQRSTGIEVKELPNVLRECRVVLAEMKRRMAKGA